MAVNEEALRALKGKAVEARPQEFFDHIELVYGNKCNIVHIDVDRPIYVTKEVFRRIEELTRK
jgi:hypothetical protein